MSNKLIENENADEAENFFNKFGKSDIPYMRSHWARFINTRDFALENIGQDESLSILDVGAHWLHNALLYANRGHRLTCIDAPDLMQTSMVQAAADAMGAELKSTRRLEIAEGFDQIESDSIDLVLFCEIIEHIAFNPIPFWKEIYRILKPGGRIIITTPNAFYYRSVRERLNKIFQGECFGNTIEQIFKSGTYGHHWKEFSLKELQNYFAYLSLDFDTTRFKMVCHNDDKHVEISGAIENLISSKTEMRAYNIYLDVVLKEKTRGIVVSPPWIPA